MATTHERRIGTDGSIGRSQPLRAAFRCTGGRPAGRNLPTASIGPPIFANQTPGPICRSRAFVDSIIRSESARPLYTVLSRGFFRGTPSSCERAHDNSGYSVSSDEFIAQGTRTRKRTHNTALASN